MSRIGKKVINVPAKTKVEVKGQTITATGALGTLSYTCPADVTINFKDNVDNAKPITGTNELNATFVNLFIIFE